MRSADGDRAITLRPLTAADLELVHGWYQDERLFLDLVGAFFPRPRDEAVAWMTQHWLDPAAADVRLAVCRTADGVHIGNVYLTAIDRRAGTADFHILIGDAQHRGKGYGTAATRAAMAHAFAHLGLRRLRLEVLSRNLRARRVYEKCGFVLEAVRPRAVLKADGWHDICVMAYAIGENADASARHHPVAVPTCRVR